MSPLQSKNLRGCLPDAMLLFQQTTRWLKSPARTRAPRGRLLVCRKPQPQPPQGLQSAVHPYCNIPQVPPHSDLDPQILSRHVSSLILGHGVAKEHVNIKPPALLCLAFLNVLYPPVATFQPCAPPHKGSVTLMAETLQPCLAGQRLLVARRCAGTRGQPLNACLLNASENGMG